jgi:putative acetyltransferase
MTHGRVILRCMDVVHAPETTGSRSGYVIAPASPREPGIVALLEDGAAYLRGLYPPEANHFLDVDQLDVPELEFYVARDADGRAVATAGFLRLDGTRAELKRMYVDPPARGRGLASDLLDRLEAEARSIGCTELVLETGPAQREALALYRASGYRQIPNFGPYVGAELSLCMTKAL